MSIWFVGKGIKVVKVRIWKFSVCVNFIWIGNERLGLFCWNWSKLGFFGESIRVLIWRIGSWFVEMVSEIMDISLLGVGLVEEMKILLIIRSCRECLLYLSVIVNKGVILFVWVLVGVVNYKCLCFILNWIINLLKVFEIL